MACCGYGHLPPTTPICIIDCWFRFYWYLLVATTYKFHESIRREIDSSKSFRKVKSKVSRSGSDWTFSDRFRFALELWNAHRPENQLAYSIVTISLFSNLIGGLGLYVWLSTKLLHQLGSSLVALSLWSLPALMLATIGSVYLWTS